VEICLAERHEGDARRLAARIQDPAKGRLSVSADMPQDERGAGRNAVWNNTVRRDAMTKHAVLLALCLIGVGAGDARAEDGYPTTARVDYVLGCMAANGQGQEVMRKCACSIDEIAARFPYDKYVVIETARVMQDAPGERASLVRGAAWIKDLQEEFRQIQVAADLKCF